MTPQAWVYFDVERSIADGLSLRFPEEGADREKSRMKPRGAEGGGQTERVRRLGTVPNTSHNNGANFRFTHTVLHLRPYSIVLNTYSPVMSYLPPPTSSLESLESTETVDQGAMHGKSQQRYVFCTFVH